MGWGVLVNLDGIWERHFDPPKKTNKIGWRCVCFQLDGFQDPCNLEGSCPFPAMFLVRYSS